MVTLTKSEYQKLKRKAEIYDRIVEVTQADFFGIPDGRKVKHVYLRGAAAKQLDREVERALKNHREGKTRLINSLADLR